MNYLFSLNTPMQSTFDNRANTLIKQSLLILFGVIFLAVASQLYVPFKPVPLTFQSAAVILIGMAYGPRNGSYVIITYLLAGLCGLPVFAEFHAGPMMLFDPSVGYLLGFLPAVILSGYLVRQGWGRNVFSSLFAAILGDAVIFGCGVVALAKFIGWNHAIALGVMPFIISEPIKLVAVALVVPKFWKTQN